MKKEDQHGHGDHAEQGGHHIDEAGVLAVMAVEMVHLCDCGRAGRGSAQEADEQDGAPILHHAREPGTTEKQKCSKRKGNEAQRYDKRQLTIGEESAPVHGTDEHAGDDHAQRADHAAYSVYGQAGDFWEARPGNEKEHACKDGQYVDVEQDVFQMEAAASVQQRIAVRPEQGRLPDEETAGVQHPLRAEYIDDDGDDELPPLE